MIALFIYKKGECFEYDNRRKRRDMEAELISKFYDLSDEAETCATSDTESLINGMIKNYETLFHN